MRLGLHYHIPFIYNSSDNSLYTASYFGVFVDGLLKEVTELVIFGYIVTSEESNTCNYKIESQNYKFVSLGIRNSVPKRLLRSGRYFTQLKKHLKELDSFIIRTPTPMIIPSSYIKSSKIHPLVVGEYENAINTTPKGFRGNMLKRLYRWMWSKEKSIVNRNLSFTNSNQILNNYKSSAKQILQIKTTTIHESDAYQRNDTCINPIINLLYVGRLDPMKNIEGIIEAVDVLNKTTNNQFFLHLAYLEEPYGLMYRDKLESYATELDVKDKIIFHGQKTVGEELNAIYRNADIFIIASLTEGFPRVIWESMINSCPVIATRVGSIPFSLTDGQNARLIDPGNNLQIKDAILEMVNNGDLRRNIIANAMETVLENTIEKQSKILIDLIFKSDVNKNNKNSLS